MSGKDDAVHEYGPGAHGESVDQCPDCGRDTEPAEITLVWTDPADIVGFEGRTCPCSSRWFRFKLWLQNQLPF